MNKKIRPPFLILPNDNSEIEFRSTLDGIMGHYESNDIVEYEFYDLNFKRLIFRPVGKSSRLALERLVESANEEELLARISKILRRQFPTENTNTSDIRAHIVCLAERLSADKARS